MRGRLNTVWVAICMAAMLSFAFGFVGVAYAAANESGEYNVNTPNEPQGEPDNDFVKSMKALFPAESKSSAPVTDGSTKLSVKSIVAVPERASIWTDKETYRSGDDARIFFRIPRAAYVYILNIDVQGKINLVFPNSSDRNPFFNRSGNYSLPRGNYAFPVMGPAGREHLILIAASEPISYFDRVRDRGGDFTAVDNAGQIIRLFSEWMRNTPAWSVMAWNSFNITTGSAWYGPRNQNPVARIQASDAKVTMGSTVTFNSRGSVDPDGWVREYRWDFNGDGRTDATGDTARYTFTSPGVYTARLTVEDNRGATATATAQIVVEARKTLLEIETDSRSRAVYIDGAYVGSGDVRQYVGSGSHTVKVIGPDNQTYVAQIDVAPGMRGVKMEVSF